MVVEVVVASVAVMEIAVVVEVVLGVGVAPAPGGHWYTSNSTRCPPKLDLPQLPGWDPKQGTAGPGLDSRPGALH